jgi:hypothetical protein
VDDDEFRAPRSWLRDQRIGAGIVVSAILVLGFVLWFALDLAPNAGETTATATTVTQARGPLAATPADLEALATSIGHPVYWAGPRAGMTYELTVQSSGQALIRYLPAGVPVGGKGSYLTVGTYPVVDAYAVTNSIVGSNVVSFKIPNNGIAEYTKNNPYDIHLAYFGVDAQIEVLDPSGNAISMARDGKIVAAQ